MKLPHSGPIAQAVAGEVDRLTHHPDFHLSEGAAYKAAWDRAGSDALKHCESFRRDCLTLDAWRALSEQGCRHVEVFNDIGGLL